MRLRLVWKLSIVVVAILTAGIALSGYVNNLVTAHYSLESARAFLRFNSESIINAIGRLMMSRDNEGIEQLLGEMSQDSTVYGDIRLVSHHTGEIVISRFGGNGTSVAMDEWACAVCHDQPDLELNRTRVADAVIDRPGGDRALSVMAPILNAPGCRNAACHAHAESPPILGFLNVDYSLEPIDATIGNRRTVILVTVLVSLLLGILALWFMFSRLLARPIAGLVAGTNRIVDNQLDFRFDPTRDDEIGVLERSFDTMTARIQTHRNEIRSAMDYLSGIVESSADLIISVTPDGHIETFNRGAEQALGYSRAEVIGRPIKTLFADPRDRDVAVARLRDTDNVTNYETRFLSKDGQVREVLLTLSRLRDKDGNSVGTIGISKDITQEKQLLRELVQSKKFAAIGQAVTGIHHAIKNMLNSLKGGAYLIRLGVEKDQRRQVEEGREMLEEGIARIIDLSNHMLHYAKEWKPDLQSVDLGELTARICDLNRQTAAGQGVTLRRELAGGLPAVRCDPKLMHMAVTDILINAIEACVWKDYGPGESAEVVVSSTLADDGRFFVLEVRDNGCGMTEDIRQHIFTPFFSTKKTTGTGLGLAQTARVIKAHGGEVRVESEPDQGAAFRIYLPIDGPSETRGATDA
ncbi:MAG: sensor histidine kinase [Planctomycetota bacterium]|jgi:PAS domain S-box-containing protein